MPVAMENFAFDAISVPLSWVRPYCNETDNLFICLESAETASSVFLLFIFTKTAYLVCRSTSVAI